MQKSKLVLSIVLILSPSIIFAETKSAPITKSQTNIVRHETEGNLEVTHDLKCLGFSDLKNEHTPADLYSGLRKCLQESNFKSAAEMYILAGVYSTFDMKRVADQTAHQARAVLSMQAMSAASEEQKKLLLAEMEKRLSPGSPNLEENCESVREIGKPDYFPGYMIQHGMAAFHGQQENGGLVENFDPDQAWESVLDSYLHCPAA